MLRSVALVDIVAGLLPGIGVNRPCGILPAGWRRATRGAATHDLSGFQPVWRWPHPMPVSGFCTRAERTRTPRRTRATLLRAFAVFVAMHGALVTATEAVLIGAPPDPRGGLVLIPPALSVLGALADELAIVLLTVAVIVPPIVPVGLDLSVINPIARDGPLPAFVGGVSPDGASDLRRRAIICAVPCLSLAIPETMK